MILPSPQKWMERRVWKFVLIAMGLLIAPTAARAESPSVIEVGKFSSGTVGQAMPDGWKPLTFKKIPKHTSYEVVKEGESVVVKAMSDASASGLTKEVRIDPKEYPIIRWRWRVENLLKRSDVNRKDGDDYPARLYVTFEYDPEKTSFSKKLTYKAGTCDLWGHSHWGAQLYLGNEDACRHDRRECLYEFCADDRGGERTAKSRNLGRRGTEHL